MSSVRPEFVHVFQLRTGDTLRCPQGLARRTMDKRPGARDAEVVWEVTAPSGVVQRLWPDEIVGWELVAGVSDE